MGLPIFELKNIKDLKEGDEINISPDNGTIENLNTKSKQNFISIPTFMQELIDAGGLMEFAKKELQEEK
jgi:3-isopropylmalate/(R)-2-methylmalate dehydratase small subunit